VAVGTLAKIQTAVEKAAFAILHVPADPDTAACIDLCHPVVRMQLQPPHRVIKPYSIIGAERTTVAGHVSSMEPHSAIGSTNISGSGGVSNGGLFQGGALEDVLIWDMVSTQAAFSALCSRASQEPGADGRVAEENDRRDLASGGTWGCRIVPFTAPTCRHFGPSSISLLRDWVQDAVRAGGLGREPYLTGINWPAG
jgi:hypothetical protein